MYMYTHPTNAKQTNSAWVTLQNYENKIKIPTPYQSFLSKCLYSNLLIIISHHHINQFMVFCTYQLQLRINGMS